jgi:hypothetical protein
LNRSFMNMGKMGEGLGLLQPDIRETQKAGKRSYLLTTALYVLAGALGVLESYVRTSQPPS